MSSVGAVLGWMLVGGFALGALAVRQGWIDLARVPLLGRAFGRATPDTEPSRAMARNDVVVRAWAKCNMAPSIVADSSRGCVNRV